MSNQVMNLNLNDGEEKGMNANECEQTTEHDVVVSPGMICFLSKTDVQV